MDRPRQYQEGSACAVFVCGGETSLSFDWPSDAIGLLRDVARQYGANSIVRLKAWK